MTNIGTSIARAAALAVSGRIMNASQFAYDWKVRLSANCIYDCILKASNSDVPSDHMRAAGRHASRIIEGTV